MAQMPEIKPEVNKEPEKKRGGLLGRWFGGGAGGGGLGAGGIGGGLSGLGGTAAGGGLLATKAGLLALIMMGSAVAGGIGLLGYRLFGPGADQGGGGDNLQLFAAKPKDGSGSDAQGASRDGNSASLNYLSQANSQPKEAGADAAGGLKDASAAGGIAAGADAAAASAHAGGAINAAGSGGNGVNKNLLKVPKIGELAKGFGGGAGGGGGSSASANGAGKSAAELAAAAARNAATSGMKKGPAMAGGQSRSLAGARSGRAIGQAFGALKDGQKAQTSYAAGKTFDGSAPTSGGNVGPAGGAIGGPGEGAVGAQPTSTPNAALDANKSTPPPTPTAVDAAPWQNAINTAQIMLVLAGLLLYAMSKIPPHLFWLKMVVGAIVLGMSAAIIALGSKIAYGEYGQTLQGNVLAAAGAGLAVATTLAMMNSEKVDASKGGTGEGGAMTTDETAAADKTATATDAKNDIMGINPYVLLGGGMGLIGVAACQLKPPVKHPSSDFQNGQPPDVHWFGYQEPPSETALKKMIA